MDISWVPTKAGHPLPPGAIRGGHDTNGDDIYVGRARHHNLIMAAKVIPAKNGAFICRNGKEFHKLEYDILTGTNYSWAPCISIHGRYTVPQNALPAGEEASGETMYIGRGFFKGSLTVGKVYPPDGTLYIPYEGKEYSLTEYEVLVSPNYCPSTKNKFDLDDDPPSYEAAMANTVTSHTAYENPLPYNPHYSAALLWVPAKSNRALPPRAIRGGQDTNGDEIFVGRARHNRELLPAKVVPAKNGAFVCWDGREFGKYEFEVLVGNNYSWIPASNGNVPLRAVQGGRESKGEPYYIGRGYFNGSLAVGKVHRSHGCLYIPYGGKEHCLKHYEVLVEL